MKNILFLFISLSSTLLFAQVDSLKVGDKYLEDQLYLAITYNQLYNQPDNVVENGFSFGLATGFIKDIPLTKSGQVALGIGLGYSYNTYNHGFKLSSNTNDVIFEVLPNIGSNKLKLHNLEIPFEFRWRTSTATRYKFWRVYPGFKISYNLKNTFNYLENGVNSVYTNVARFNKFQYGLTLSAGYSAFNIHVYYGLTKMLNDATIGTNNISTRMIKLGFIFYIL